VRNPLHVARYGNLEVKWIDHHNPDLVLFDSSNSEVHRVDMTRLTSTASMHKLMVLLGLTEVCHDANSSCETWAANGECARNPVFMKESCRKSCKSCPEGSKVVNEPLCRDVGNWKDCEYWSTMGECSNNENWMREQCARSCGFCSNDDEPKDEL